MMVFVHNVGGVLLRYQCRHGGVVLGVRIFFGGCVVVLLQGVVVVRVVVNIFLGVLLLMRVLMFLVVREQWVFGVGVLVRVMVL